MKSGKKTLPTDPNKRPVIYWDTCVLLAWMMNEVRPPGEMEGVEEAASLILSGKAVLVTSTLTRAEVLRGTMPKSALDKMDKLFRRPNVIPLILDTPVAALTAELREFYNATDFELLTPDAIHLATAIHHKVSEFHTFDGSDPNKKPRKSSKKRCGLLLLDGNAGGHALKICKPSAQQLNLLVALPTVPEEKENEANSKTPDTVTVPINIRSSGSGDSKNKADVKGKNKARGKEAGKE